jgi:hypothetical protein
MAIDRDQVVQCLDEVERELFRIADDSDCQKFHKNSQLSATLLLLLRGSSLLRSMLRLVEERELEDGFHLVARGFEETWNLAHDFRLNTHGQRAMNWFAGKDKSWSARIGVLLAFAVGRGHRQATLGHDYNLLSELSHPTRSAAENSVTLCGVRQGIDGADRQIAGEQENCEHRVTTCLYKLLWLLLDQDRTFITIPVDETLIPACSAYVKAYPHIDPATL